LLLEGVQNSNPKADDDREIKRAEKKRRRDQKSVYGTSKASTIEKQSTMPSRGKLLIAQAQANKMKLAVGE
jgi:hypothetical protein